MAICGWAPAMAWSDSTALNSSRAPMGIGRSHGTVVIALVGARDGSLWAGFADVEGVSRLRNGQVTNYGARDGLPEGMITVLLQDREGTLWAGGLGGLSAFRDSCVVIASAVRQDSRRFRCSVCTKTARARSGRARRRASFNGRTAIGFVPPV